MLPPLTSPVVGEAAALLRRRFELTKPFILFSDTSKDGRADDQFH
jgi:hypothetical protein